MFLLYAILKPPTFHNRRHGEARRLTDLPKVMQLFETEPGYFLCISRSQQPCHHQGLGLTEEEISIELRIATTEAQSPDLRRPLGLVLYLLSS